MRTVTGIDEKVLLAKIHANWKLLKSDFWKFAKYLVTEDQQRGKIRPIPVCEARYVTEVNADAEVWPFLGPLFDALEKERFKPFLKSRRTFVTNICCARMFWKAFFTDRTAKESYLACISSQDKDEAKLILKRLHTMYRHLPAWLKKMNIQVTKSTEECAFQLGGLVRAFPAKGAKYRGEGYKDILADEFAFHPDDKEALDGMMGSVIDGGQVAVVSTPNGKNTEFYHICIGRDNPNLKPHKVHWRQVPGRDDAWKARIMKELYWSSERWAREMEHSFESAAGPAMFEGYDYITHVRPLGFHFPETVTVGYCGWDIGVEAPAALLCYMNTEDQLVAHLGIVGHRPKGGMAGFVKEVKEFRKTVFPHNRWVDYVPHDAETTSQDSGEELIEAWISQDIIPEVNRDRHPEVGWEMARRLMALRADGKPGFLINEDGTYLTTTAGSQRPELRNVMLEGFQGAFVRRARKTPRGVEYDDEPDRTHPFIDVFDAWNCLLRMLFTDSLPVNNFGADVEQGEITQISV